MKTILAALLLVSLPTIALAQDAGLPPECATPHAGHAMTAPMDMSMLPPGQAHSDLAGGMDRMHADMMAGMMAEDVDAAFVCGMIPHHQGAIDMARAVLNHGDDPWVRELAEKIIAAQEDEIAQMKKWLAENAAHTAH